ncbi:MAG: hypothetical protein KKH40_02015, partial [Nanoarchaeota archaeon]|nr:hypothetical protein [Nanoarchaeota archaeon]
MLEKKDISKLIFTDIRTPKFSDEKEIFSEFPPGGIILFHGYQYPGINIVEEQLDSKQNIKSLIYKLKKEFDNPLIGVDFEGGKSVKRLQSVLSVDSPSARELFLEYIKGKQKDVCSYLKKTAIEIKSLGFDFINGPVCDLPPTYSNCYTISALDRAFGSTDDYLDVSNIIKDYIEIFTSQGISCIAKHFPGYGAVKCSSDAHSHSPTLDAVSEQELLVFKSAVQAGALGLMTSHVLFKNLSDDIVTFSKNAVLKLREKISYNGLIFTDDLTLMTTGLLNGSNYYSSKQILDNTNKHTDENISRLIDNAWKSLNAGHIIIARQVGDTKRIYLGIINNIY